jgi:hypothetical protein
MLIALKHLPPNFREQLHNEEVASVLFPKIMDRSYQAPHNAISGWCQYVRYGSMDISRVGSRTMVIGECRI